MRHLIALFLSLFFLSAEGQIQIKDTNLKGKIYRFEKMKCRFLDPRNVDVWVPADFDSSGKTRYNVLYVHDGQNQFLPGYAFGGAEWGLDEALDSLMQAGLIRKTIVVAIWNSPRRFIEYNPEDAFNKLDSVNRNKIIQERGGKSLANQYLAFIFDDLKPMIDSVFPTRSEMKYTHMMGSSMGGLISLYALCKYSDKVKSVACLSTHWPLSLKENNAEIAKAYANYFASRLPNPKQHKLYFDYGDQTLDAWYKPHQEYMTRLCIESGYRENTELLSLYFQGEAHNEIAWRKRVAIPLLFMLKP